MKIKRNIPKKLTPPIPVVRNAVEEILSCEMQMLADVLLRYSKRWDFGRGDLFHWVSVLDKLDRNLEVIVEKYKLTEIQRNEFSSSDKHLVIIILSFTKILLENCVNRTIYSSFEHLNCLLYSSDLAVLESTLLVLYIFAYKFTGKNMTKTNPYHVNLSNIKVLAICEPPNMKEHASTPYSSLCQGTDAMQLISNWGSTFSFKFYRFSDEAAVPSERISQSLSSQITSMDVVINEEKKNENATGLVLIKRSKLYQVKKSNIEIMDDLISQYKIPSAVYFELFHRIRTNRDFFNQESRISFFSIKFLALSILAPTFENNPYNFHIELFTKEPDFLKELSSLIHVSNEVPSNLRSSAVMLFDILIRYRIKMTDALSALNFGTFQGVLTQFIKHASENIHQDYFNCFPESFIDGMLNLISFIVSSQVGSNSIVSSNIIPLIVNFVGQNGKYDSNAHFALKCINLLDSILYSFPAAFSQFLNSEGILIFVQEISRICIKAISNGYPLNEENEIIPDCGTMPATFRLYLKSLLKLILHLMQSSGTMDGLRNLIDTTLPSSLVLIFQNLSIYGSMIYAQAVSILATFINNEPTALAILLEMNLPQEFINSISSKIPISGEVCNVLFLALGAICLNSTGMDLVANSQVLSKILSIFFDRKYLRMLQDCDAPSALGAGFDEFIRHQPSMKTKVFSQIIDVFGQLDTVSLEITSPDDLVNCRFLPQPNDSLEAEVTIAESFDKSEPKEPLIPQIIEIFCVFLEAFLQSESNKTQFTELGGVHRLLSIYSLDTLSYDFSSSLYSFSIFHLFKSLVEFQPEKVLTEMFSELSSHISSINSFLLYSGDSSFFLPAIYAKTLDELNDYQLIRRHLVGIHGIMSLITDIFSLKNVSSKLALGLLNSLFDGIGNLDLLKSLWKLYNCCTWEFHQFKFQIPNVWLNRPKKDAHLSVSMNESILIADPNDRRIKNMKSIRYLLTQIPTSFIPLTCKMVEVLGNTSLGLNEELSLKKDKIISIIAELLSTSLKWKRSSTQVLAWFDYISVIIGHSLVLFFSESDGRQNNVNIDVLESFVFNEMSGLNESLEFALLKISEQREYQSQHGMNIPYDSNQNPLLLEDKSIFSTLNSFLFFIKKLLEHSLLKSLNFVDSTDFQLISGIRLKGSALIMKIWNSSIFLDLPIFSLEMVFKNFSSILFDGPYIPSQSELDADSDEYVEGLVKIGFPKSFVKKASLFCTDANQCIIFLVTNTRLRDDNDNPLYPELVRIVDEFKRSFPQRIVALISKAYQSVEDQSGSMMDNSAAQAEMQTRYHQSVSNRNSGLFFNHLLPFISSLIKQVYDLDFEQLFSMVDSIPVNDVKISILAQLASEKQGFTQSPLLCLNEKIDYIFSLSTPSNYNFILSIIESILSHGTTDVVTETEPISVDRYKIWIEKVTAEPIKSDSFFLLLFKCLIIINKRFNNVMDITRYISLLADVPISNHLAPSIFSLLAILCHLYVQNDFYDYQLMSTLVKEKIKGKMSPFKIAFAGFEYTFNVNADIFREVYYEEIFKSTESEEIKKRATTRTSIYTEKEQHIVLFLMKSFMQHGRKDIFNRICLLLLTEIFHSYQGACLCLTLESFPTKDFITALLRDHIPYPRFVENTSEFKDESEKECYFQSFLASFTLNVLISDCGAKDENANHTFDEYLTKNSKVSSQYFQLRKLILEQFYRILKETINSSTITIRSKYNSLLAYLDLLFKFLSSKLNKFVSNQIILYNVKFFNEKKIFSTLTHLLQEIDVNYPNAHLIFNSVLKSIDFIARVTNKIEHCRSLNQDFSGNEIVEMEHDGDDDDLEDIDEDESEDESDELSDDDSEDIDDNDELVYDSEMENDSGFENEFESDYSESDDDTEIVIRPHSLVPIDDSHDENSDDAMSVYDEEFIPHLEHSNSSESSSSANFLPNLTDFGDHNVDIIIEEHDDNDSSFYDEEAEDDDDERVHSREFDDDFEDDYVVFSDGDGNGPEDDQIDSFSPVTLNDRIATFNFDDSAMVLGRRPPVTWRQSSSNPAVIRLDLGFNSFPQTQIPQFRNHRIGEVPFATPSLSLNPPAILNSLSVARMSGTSDCVPDELNTVFGTTHSISSNPLANILNSANNTFADILSPPTSADRLLRNQSNSQPSVNPLTFINVMPIALVPTRWIQMDKLLGRYFSSKSIYLYSSMITSFMELSRQRRNEENTDQHSSQQSDENEPETDSASQSDEESSSHNSAELSQPSSSESEQLSHSLAAVNPSDNSTEYTDNGIDVSYFEAIPIDLRSEALAQHFQERRRNLPHGARITISPGFLEALSPELRDVYVQESEREIELNRIFSAAGDAYPMQWMSELQNQTSDDRLVFSSGIMDIFQRLANRQSDFDGHVTIEMRDEDEDEGDDNEDEDEEEGAEEHHNLSKVPLALVYRSVEPCIDISLLESIILSYYVSPPHTKKRIFFSFLRSAIENYQTLRYTIDTLLNHLQYFLYAEPESVFSSSSRTIPNELIPSKNILVRKVIDVLEYLVISNSLVSKRLCEEVEKLAYTLSPPSNSLPTTPTSYNKKRKRNLSKNPSVVKKTKIPLVLLIHLFCFIDTENHSLVSHYLNFLLKLTEEMIDLFNTAIPKESPVDSTKKEEKSNDQQDVADATELVNAPMENQDTELDHQNVVQSNNEVIEQADSQPSIQTNNQDICPASNQNCSQRPAVNFLTSPNISSTDFSSNSVESHVNNHQFIGHLDKLPAIPSGLLNEFLETAVWKHGILITNYKALSSILKNLSHIPKVKQDIVKELLSICKSTLIQSITEDLGGGVPKITPDSLTKFIGVLRLIDESYDSLIQNESTSIIQALSYFDPLWLCLDNLLSSHSFENESQDLDVSENLSSLATLLPLIESFFLVYKWKCSKPEEDSYFVGFVERYRKLFNHLIKGTPSLLTGSMEILLKFPKLIDFDNKRSYFRSQLRKQSASDGIPQSHTLNLVIRRNNIFEDTFQKIMGYSGKELRNSKLHVKFYQEEGVDVGGVTREFFSELARQIFNPNYALFRTSALDRITYQPNRCSSVNPDHLLYFEFVGRIIAKAICDGRLLDCYFTRSFYKHILGIPVDYKDMEAVDPEIYKSLLWILENPISPVLEMTFSSEMDDFGKTRVIDLIPDGQNVAVTDDNKHEYVRLVSELKLTTAIQSQINAFLRGFQSLIPQSLISLFDENELELLISGMPDIDVDDWKNNTVYDGYTSSSVQIQWFWRTVRSFSLEERAKLLQFTTGTSKVPLEGFSSLQGSAGVQKFQIHKDFGSIERLPSAHTCFNQLDLPMYESYEQLRKQLSLAITECATGFGLV